MKKENLAIIAVMLLGTVMTIGFAESTKSSNNLDNYLVILHDSIDYYSLELTPENFKYICTIYDIKHPEIVYAQALLESGNFSSNVYKTKNNFLGLYDSRHKEYYTFEHWSECLMVYKSHVQNKWKGENDYYEFLNNLPYAEDPTYIKKVKSIVKANK